MTLLKYSALLISLAALQACSSHTSSTKSAENNTASLENPDTIQPQTFVLRGQVIVGHEVNSITPCGSNKQFWLALDETQRPQAAKLVRSPYQPLYGEVIGHLATPNPHGFDSDFEARFVVDQINFLTAENPERCNQPPKATQVFGNEPNWSATFKGDDLIFQRMGFEAQSLAIRSNQITANKREYTLRNGELLLEEKICSDSMSDSLYGWRASMTLDGETYKGCATLSNQDATVNWQGSYHAKSTETMGFSVQMTLLSDHTAMIQYEYNNGESATVEKGFWQQLDSNQVQVVMTHHQGQPLRSERIFTRNDQQITTTHEKVGNIVYPIANGGLTLFKHSISAAQ
ncbi:COG3650 family protein [Vibrio amylolyticus]|uniref:COG3650 family protein n=1 Tax=Vibrio TaxID=662 RepID=UPI000C81BAC7|nr:hypothetical protein [Vibrio sp. 10N.261.55.A7]PMK02796.1 hypothetical protein BCU12_18020 [Vibrio sp. 10N.261.55.A7]